VHAEWNQQSGHGEHNFPNLQEAELVPGEGAPQPRCFLS
jgi:hypothetical protein